MEDDSLYNAIIAALAIGIVIVIITLFVARPQPETFTELYLNNHQQLPKYVTSNQIIPFSFSIANHERTQTNYTYNITTSFYQFNRACNQPKIYFEPKEEQKALPPSTQRPSGTNRTNITLPPKEPDPLPSRIATSTDPALLIKDTNFSAQLNFRTLNGRGILAVKYKTINGSTLLAATVDEEKNQLSLSDGKKILTKPINVTKGNQQTLRLTQKANELSATVNGKSITSIPFTPQPGFLSVETLSTYAQSDLIITQSGQQQKASFPHADATTYAEEFVANNQRFEASQLNFSRLDLETQFRLNNATEVSLGITDVFSLTYTKNQLTFNGITYTLNATRRNVHAIKVEVNNNQAHAWVDGTFIATIPVQETKGVPFIKADGSDVRTFSITSLDGPQRVQLSLPTKEEPLPATPLRGFLLNQPTENITEVVSDLYAEDRLDWKNYYITGRYRDPFDNGTITLRLFGQNQTIYSFAIDNRIQVAHISSLFNNTLENFSTILDSALSDEKEFNIDVKGSEATFIVDNIIVLTRTLDLATGGVLLLNTTSDMQFDTLYVQDKDSPVVRIFEPPQQTCEPLPLNETTTQLFTTLANNETKQFSADADFHGGFDLAKVSVSLDKGQEVHFWVVGT